eukprot:13754990-Alexandrium_andersonii.AAC.1
MASFRDRRAGAGRLSCSPESLSARSIAVVLRSPAIGPPEPLRSSRNGLSQNGLSQNGYGFSVS